MAEKQRLLPYHAPGYYSDGREKPDPNSTRQKRLNSQKAKNGLPPADPPAKAPPKDGMRRIHVRETCHPSIIGEKIGVLEGPNLRSLRDGLGLRSPGIIPPEKRQPKPFRKAVRNALTSICNRDLIASGDLRSANLLSILQGKFLEKGAEANELFIGIVRKDGGPSH